MLKGIFKPWRLWWQQSNRLERAAIILAVATAFMAAGLALTWIGNPIGKLFTVLPVAAAQLKVVCGIAGWLTKGIPCKEELYER